MRIARVDIASLTVKRCLSINVVTVFSIANSRFWFWCPIEQGDAFPTASQRLVESDASEAARQGALGLGVLRHMKLRLAVEHRQEANCAFAVTSLRFIYRLPVVGQLSADRGVARLLGGLVGKRILHFCERPQNRLL